MAKNQIATIPLTASASGQTAVKAAETGVIHQVLALSMSAAGTVTAKFQSANTDLTGAWNMVAGVPIQPPVPPTNPSGGMPALFATAAGEALNINLGGAVAVGGTITIRSISQSP